MRIASKYEDESNYHQYRAEISSLCRGAVVLLSSHVEAYVKELGEHALDNIHSKKVCRSKLAPQFFYHISKKAIDPIRGASEPGKIVEHVRMLIDNQEAFGDISEPFQNPISSLDFNQGFSNPTFEKVNKYLNRFGYSSFKSDFYDKLQESAQGAENNLDNIVNTRNSIAHGDNNATKTPQEVRDMIRHARIFCKTTDMLFGEWCRNNLCTIR